MRTIHKKNKKLREDIHDMLEDNKVNEKKVNGLIDEYFNNESGILELRHTHHKEIGSVLTDEQTIKYAGAITNFVETFRLFIIILLYI